MELDWHLLPQVHRFMKDAVYRVGKVAHSGRRGRAVGGSDSKRRSFRGT